MKKLIGILLSVFFFFLVLDPIAFASTFFFTAKDGTIFCETDAYDGSYAPCSSDEIIGGSLVTTRFPTARLIDTPSKKLCVEQGKEVDMNNCQEEIDTLEKLMPKKNIVLQTVATGSTYSGVLQAPLTGISSTSSIAKNTAPPPSYEEGLVGAVVWGYQNCIGGETSTANCIPAIFHFLEVFLGMGKLFILASIIILMGSIVFYSKMLLHASSRTIPYKILWILIILLLSLPGAILYYLCVERPALLRELAARPPEPPSFFS